MEAKEVRHEAVIWNRVVTSLDSQEKLVRWQSAGGRGGVGVARRATKLHCGFAVEVKRRRRWGLWLWEPEVGLHLRSTLNTSKCGSTPIARVSIPRCPPAPVKMESDGRTEASGSQTHHLVPP